MQIIDAAVEVIAENGYHQSQVSKIAKQAGVADGTIYLYFKNKEDILISLFKEKMGQFIERMEEDIKEKATAKEKLALVISKHFSLLAGDHNLAIVTQLEPPPIQLGAAPKNQRNIKRLLKYFGWHFDGRYTIRRNKRRPRCPPRPADDFWND